MTDLKPSNVLVVHGEVKLLDFGIASDHGGGTDFAGTLDYMAPELLLLKPATVASDLYSAGVLMHQILTGEFPFSRESVAKMLEGIFGAGSDQTLPPTVLSLLERYLSASPDPMMELNLQSLGNQQTVQQPRSHVERSVKLSADLPIKLARIIHKLLERHPQDRFSDAGMVLKELAAAVQFPLPIETAETRESFLQATELIGREAELALLKVALDRSQNGHFQGYLIGGESGIGKSRLTSELRTQALVNGFWVVEGQSITEGATYYQEWLPLLRSLCFRTALTDAEASIFKDLVPDIGELLGREVDFPPKVRPEEMQTRLGSTLLAVLGKLQKPLLIILEDLHWVRSESLSLLSQLMQQGDGQKVLLVGTYRTDDGLNLQQRLPKVQRIILKRLNSAEIARLSASILGEVGSKAEMVEYLERQTEGNVFFLIEIMRALAENAGELGRISAGLLPEQLLTVGIERIVESRIDHLDAVYLPMLEFAATVGRRLDLALMAQAFPSVALRPFLVQCANAAVLEPQGNEWRFAHDKLREAILRRIGAEELRLLHRQISEQLEFAYHGEKRDRISARLAFHCAKGQRPERAVIYYTFAGDEATRLGLWSESRNHYRDALATLAEMPPQFEAQQQRIDLLLNLVHCSQIFDTIEVQLQRLGEAQNLLNVLAQTADFASAVQRRQVRLDYLTGRAHYYNGNPGVAIELYKRVLAQAAESEDLEITAMPSAMIGMALASQGHFGRAHSFLARAVKPLQHVGNEFELVRTQMYDAMVLSMSGQYQAGMAEIERGELRGQALEQPQLLNIVRVLRALVCRSGMDWPAMLEWAKSVGATAEKLGERLYMSLSFSMEAWALSQLGRFEEASGQRRKALAITQEFGGKHVISDWFAAHDAQRAILMGDANLAQILAREVVQSSAAQNLPLSWGIAERAWGVALASLGEAWEAVEAHMQESLRVLGTGGLLLEIAQTELWWGKILNERQEVQAARPHFDKALAIFESAGCAYAVAEVRKAQAR